MSGRAVLKDKNGSLNPVCDYNGNRKIGTGENPEYLYWRISDSEAIVIWDIASMNRISPKEEQINNYKNRAHRSSKVILKLSNGKWEVTEFYDYGNFTEYKDVINNCPVQSAELNEIIDGWEEYLTHGSTSSNLLAERMGVPKRIPTKQKPTETENMTTMNKIGLVQGKLIKFDDQQKSETINGSGVIANISTLLAKAGFHDGTSTPDVKLLFNALNPTEVKVVMNVPGMGPESISEPETLKNQAARWHQNAVVTATWSPARNEWIASDIVAKGQSLRVFKNVFNGNDVLVAELNELVKGWNELLTQGTTSSTVLQERYGAPKTVVKVQKASKPQTNVTEEKEGNKKMSNGISVKDFIGSPKAEATNAMWRVAAGSAVDLVRDPLIEAICTQMGVGKNKLMRNKIALFLSTGFGRGVVAMALSMLIPGINMMVPDDMKPHMDRLAKELREHGYEHVMLPLAGLVTGPIKDQLVKAVQGVSVLQTFQSAVTTGEDASAEEIMEQASAGSNQAKA